MLAPCWSSELLSWPWCRARMSERSRVQCLDQPSGAKYVRFTAHWTSLFKRRNWKSINSKRSPGFTFGCDRCDAICVGWSLGTMTFPWSPISTEWMSFWWTLTLQLWMLLQRSYKFWNMDVSCTPSTHQHRRYTVHIIYIFFGYKMWQIHIQYIVKHWFKFWVQGGHTVILTLISLFLCPSQYLC